MEGDPATGGPVPRFASAALGVWLTASVFAWPHRPTEGFNAFMTGIFVFLVALLALWAPRLRFGNAFLGAWVLASALFFHHETLGTLFNDAAVGALVFVLSLVPARALRFPDVRAARA